MNLQWLKTYLSVLDTGSFAEAARTQHLTQPAVSMAVTALEKELGQTLLERTPGQRAPISPTREGEIFAAYARKSVGEYEAMRLELLYSAPSQSFQLVCSPIPSTFLVPGMLNLFHHRFPKAVCSVYSYSRDDTARMVRSERYDLAMTANRLPDCANITFEPFFSDPMLLACPASMDIPDVITLQQLRKLPLIVQSKNSNAYALLVRSLSAHGLTLADMNIAPMEAYDNLALLQGVGYHIGVGFVSRLYFTSQKEAANVRIVSVRGFSIENLLYMARLTDRPLNSGAQLFWDFAMGGTWRSELFDFDTLPKGER